MSKEILLVVEAVSNEKGVDRSIIFEALEAALASATKKRFGTDIEVRVSVDRRTGKYDTYRCWEVIADDLDAFDGSIQMPLAVAKQKYATAEVGAKVEELMESVEFGRIAAQTAKQVIVQKVREAERARIIERYKNRLGDLISGTVKRIDRGDVYVDVGSQAEALIKREDLIPKEPVRTGDRIRGYLHAVSTEPKGPQLLLSRTAPEFLIALFKLEVPEINDGLVEIKGAARDPGSRAKIAVRANDSRIDPVGACVGMRGSRVQSISNELVGERIDIILWDANMATYVLNAMAPAEIVSIVVDEDSHSMDVAVDENFLSQAIGRGGQNVRLASQLTGWELNVMSEAQAAGKHEVEASKQIALFVEHLGVDEEIAAILVEEGFSSIEEIAYLPAQELLKIEDFDEEIVETLRSQAKNALLIMAIADEEQEQAEVAVIYMDSPVQEINGITDALTDTLATHGIITVKDLAELSVLDLLEDIEPSMDEALAAHLIMTARKAQPGKNSQG